MNIRVKNAVCALCALFSSMTLAAPAADGVLDLLTYFQKDDNWTASPDSFIIATREYGFRYLDSGRASATSTKRESISFSGFKVYEARIFFGDDGVRRAEISLYNKGDTPAPIGHDVFEKLISEVSAKLDASFGKSPGPKEVSLGGKKLNRELQWTKQSPMIKFDWAFEKSPKNYVAEYARITLVRKGKSAAENNANLTGRSMLVKAKSLRKLRDNIVRDSKGNVVIENIPMVDQGQKGYCAASSSERILRYYGLEIDQHQIAQIAETSASRGTSVSGIADAIKQIGKEFKLDQKDIINVDDGRYFQDSQTFQDLKDYNKVAKRLKKTEIDWNDYVENRVIDIQKIWADMDPAIIMESKLRQKQNFTKFKTNIKTYVDSGIPLLWSCLVGIYPEVPDIGANGAFGHMRLIIGYNTSTHEIIYTDSWGAGHESKRMGEEQAWAMTKGLMVLKPRL